MVSVPIPNPSETMHFCAHLNLIQCILGDRAGAVWGIDDRTFPIQLAGDPFDCVPVDFILDTLQYQD